MTENDYDDYDRKHDTRGGGTWEWYPWRKILVVIYAIA